MTRKGGFASQLFFCRAGRYLNLSCAVKKSKLFLSVCFFVLSGLLIVALRWAKSSLFPVRSDTFVSARTKGLPEAPVRIIEYSDFECSACVSGFKVLQKAFEEYPDKLYMEYRFFPIAKHPHALQSARYAECAARQDLFWPLHDRLFLTQKDWSKKNDTSPVFQKIARDAGLDIQALDQCLQDEAITGVINNSFMEGRRRGIAATPTFVINGKPVVGATRLAEELNRLLRPGPNVGAKPAQ